MIQDREIEDLKHLCKRIKSRAEEMEYLLKGLKSEVQYLEECIDHFTHNSLYDKDEMTNLLDALNPSLEGWNELASTTDEPKIDEAKTDEATIDEPTTDELSIKIDSMLKSLDDF